MRRILLVLALLALPAIAVAQAPAVIRNSVAVCSYSDPTQCESPGFGWTFAASSGGITNTTAVTVATTPSVATNRNYLSGLQIINVGGGAETEVILRSGTTVLWRSAAPANNTSNGSVPISYYFANPIRGNAGAEINVSAGTTGAKLYINAQGYVAP